MVFLQYSLCYVLSISSRRLFLLMMIMGLLVAGSTGLTLKLIHRDSPESSLYPGNLTQVERLERAFQQSAHREQKLLSTWHMMKQINSRNNSTNNGKSETDTVRPGVKLYDDTSYMVKLGIGTFSSAGGSPFYYQFYFDPGSDLLWLQCDAARTGTTETKYFKQDVEIYNHEEYSLTYSPLPYNSTNRICRKYAHDLRIPAEGQGFCGYHVRYGDGSSSEGVLATEKLTVDADNGGIEEIDDFVFGCGYRQNDSEFGKEEKGKNPIVGILGLGGGEESFIQQLGDRVQKKFEYCLKPLYIGDTPDVHTFLRFGSDTKIVVGGQGVQTTATLHVRTDTLYYVFMEGISVNGEPVVYPAGSRVFEAKQDGSGGCIFDAGSEATTLSAEVYAPFVDHLIKYLYKTYRIRRRSSTGTKWDGFDLCFQKTPRLVSFPLITFRFSGGANFEIEPEAAFSGDDQMFCLTIRPSKLKNPFSVLLGSIHQTNHRILHDLGASKISWVNENCTRDPYI